VKSNVIEKMTKMKKVKWYFCFPCGGAGR